jgi:MFS family permease
MVGSAGAALRQAYGYFKQFKGFGRDIWLLMIAGFFASVVMGLSSIIQPLYLKALGYDPTAVGALLGASAIVSVSVLFPAVAFADRYGRKRVLILSILTYTLAFTIYATSTDFSSLLLASVLIGVSWGTYVGPSNAIFTDKTGLKERNYVFSLYSFLSAFAIILGSLLAGATDLVASTLHQASLEAYRTMFWVAVGLSLISLPALVLVSETHSTKHNRGILIVRSWRTIGLFSVVNGLVGFGAGVFIPLLPIYLSSKFSATEAEIGVLFAASNAAMGVANLLAPKLSERIGPVATITFTQGLSVVPLAFIPSTKALYLASLLYVTRTALMNMSTPVLNAYTMSMVSQEERASASGVITMAWNGANAAGTVASGILMSIYPDSPIFVSSLFYALSSIAFYSNFRGPRKKTPE